MATKPMPYDGKHPKRAALVQAGLMMPADGPMPYDAKHLRATELVQVGLMRSAEGTGTR